jgi:hypothetical protein
MRRGAILTLAGVLAVAFGVAAPESARSGRMVPHVDVCPARSVTPA